MKENSIEDRINNAYCFLNSMHSDFRTGLYYKEDLENLEHILSDYKRVLKENEEWQRAYQEEKDKQFDFINKISSNDSISVQKVKDKIEEYKNMLKTCNKAKDIDRIKAINERILELQELLEGRK